MKNKIISLILLLSVFMPTCTFAEVLPVVHEIHVSPDGDDLNSASLESPVKTLERAREIYRENYAKDNNYNGEILVHGGVYRLDKSFELTSEDSGITIKSYGDGEVSVRGSVKLPKGLFKKTDVSEFAKRLPDSSRDKVYEYDLSRHLDKISSYPEYQPLSGNTAYYELFLDGIPQTVARWPNQGFAYTKNSSGFTFQCDSEKLAKWKEADYGMVAGYWMYDWAFEHVYIGDIDTKKSKITLSHDLQYSDSIKNGQRYYALNLPEELDVPGEYYIDCNQKKLYYYPTEAFLDNTPELSVLTGELFNLNGASDVVISGINFEYSRGTAISSKNGNNVKIDNCVIRNIGNHGISSSSYNTIVEDCEIYNTGGGGISINSGVKVTLTRGESIVRNNNIYNFGRISRTYQAGIALDGVGNKAIFNTIHDAPHSGMRFGGNDNLISHNEIYNVVLECSDSGAIYSGRNWTVWGIEISDNYFHDILKDSSISSYTVSAIYVDDMLTGVTVKNNYFKNCTRAAFFGGGRGNTFSDNIIVDCQNGIYYDNRAVTGNWAHDSVISGGTVYENLLKFLENDDLDIELWKEKYFGFSQMLDDVYAYQKDAAHEMGYPENATVTGNSNFGKYVFDESYDNISQYVSEYGTVSDNTHTLDGCDIETPESGADIKKWNSDFEVNYPFDNAIFDKGDVEFLWSCAGGADYYEIVIKNEKGEEVLKTQQKETGFNCIVKEKGIYNWSVVAVCGDESAEKSGSFKIMKDYYLPGTLIAGTDFEVSSLDELKSNGWNFNVAEEDSVSVETDSDGNRYLKMVRNENNLLSGDATFAFLEFPEKKDGKITVTYDIMLENYRAGWRDMGSVQNASGGDVMRLLTHLSWVYGMATDETRYNFNLAERTGDSYLTIKRTIDLDNDTYSINIYQNGTEISSSKSKVCSDRAAERLIFRLGYQNPFQPQNGEGDAVYRIDNVFVDMGEISPFATFPANDEYDVSVDSDISIKWNGNINIETVNKSTVSVFENDRLLTNDEFFIEANNRHISLSLTDGLDYDSEYRVVLSKEIESDSLTHSGMSQNYEFSFFTEKNTEDDENTLNVISTFPENNSFSEPLTNVLISFNHNLDIESVNDSRVSVYKYSYMLPANEYKISSDENILSIDFWKSLENGAEYTVKISEGILPEDENIKPLDEEYTFVFSVKNEKNQNIVKNYSFEDWDDFSLTGPTTESVNGWNFVLYEGDSVSVEIDPVTGNKGLKLVKGNTTSQMQVYMDYDVPADNLIKVKFDTRFSNQSRRIHDWGTSLTKENKTFLKMFVYGSGYWHRQIGDTKRWLCGLSDSVATVEQVLDCVGNEYTVRIFKDGTKVAEKSESANSNGNVSQLRFSISNQEDNYKGAGEGDGVYWIDNVSVTEMYTPHILNVSSDCLETFEILFDRNIDIESVTKSNIKIYENENPVGYEININSNKAVSLKLPDGMKAGNTYRVEIKNILSENGNSMLKPYEEEIECKQKVLVENISAKDGYVFVEAYSNVSEYIMVIAEKDDSGNLIKCHFKDLDGAEEVSFKPMSEKYSIYFWDSFENMHPLAESVMNF